MTQAHSDFRIENPTPESLSFLAEWHNSSDFITAHTSGSTGTPKEIRLLKRDMRLSAQATNRFFGIDSHSTLYCPLSGSYIAGKMMIVRAIEADCRLFMETPSNRPFHQWRTDCGSVTMACVVPSQIPAIMEEDYRISCIDNLIIGGAPLSPDLEEQLRAFRTNMFVTYGMTETCSHVALRQLGTPLYQALPGISFSTDARGCLVIEAPAFSFRKIVTNDVVEPHSISANGVFHSFRWLGRADNAINSGGIKFHPEELERVLGPHIPVPFFIHSLPHPKWGEVVALTVEEGSGMAAEELQQLCAALLPRYARPHTVRILPRLPRTSSGKLLRR